jgi:pimeloyl-ACP methyl ester carboxylesterase
MMRRTLSGSLLALALAGGLLAPAPAVTAAAPPPGVEVPVIDWQPCGDAGPPDSQCATVAVPLDYDEPEGATVDLDLLRVPATGAPEDRIGSLFVNPGGPGGSSTGFAAFFGELVPERVSERYDIVGIDPRGVGSSAPMRCRTDEDRPAYPTSWFPTNRKQAMKQIRFDDWLRGACDPATGDPDPVVGQMSTADTARDMDLVREAVGDTELHYYGISYGTQLGSTYAAMFPGTVGRMILDGVLDPEEWTTGHGDAGTRPFSERLGSGYGAWQGLTAAFAECDRVGKRRCALAGHASEAWNDVIRKLRKGPFRGVRYDMVVGSALSYLYSPDGVPWLMREIRQLHRAMFGKGALRTDAWRPGAVQRRVTADRGIPGPYAAGWARTGNPFAGVACADSDNPADPRAWIPAGNRADQASPWFGKLWTWASSPCAGWPEDHKEDRFAGPFEATPANPVLVVGNTYDPATPLHGARAVNRLLDGSRLLVLDGWGHGALAGSACIDDAYAAYLVDGELPRSGTVCQPRRPLYPRR